MSWKNSGHQDGEGIFCPCFFLPATSSRAGAGEFLGCGGVFGVQGTGNPWGCLQSSLLQAPPRPPLGARTRGRKDPEHVPVPQHRSGRDPWRHDPFFCQVPLSHAGIWGPRGGFIPLADPTRGARGAQGTPRGLRAGGEEASSSRRAAAGRGPDRGDVPAEGNCSLSSVLAGCGSIHVRGSIRSCPRQAQAGTAAAFP